MGAEAATGSGRHGAEIKTLAEARREFAGRHSPWMILGAIAILGAIRVAIGDVGWRDAVAVAAMLVVYPFGEWAIHVYVLHARVPRLLPARFRRTTGSGVRAAGLRRHARKLGHSAARDHRQHHEDPNDLYMLLLAPKELAELLLLAVPATVAAGAVIVGLIAGPVPLGALVSAALAGCAAILVYEWTHFLIHTAYRPRSRHYRAVWRNHRLHHFKNERYWHGITNNLSDRVLGTDPDHRDVPRSATARTLEP